MLHPVSLGRVVDLDVLFRPPVKFDIRIDVLVTGTCRVVQVTGLEKSIFRGALRISK